MPCLHPIDALIRRVQKNRSRPNPRLDATIAHKLYAGWVFRKDGVLYRYRLTGNSTVVERVPEYSQRPAHAVKLLRRLKAGLPLTVNRKPAALKEAA